MKLQYSSFRVGVSAVAFNQVAWSQACRAGAHWRPALLVSDWDRKTL